MQAFLCVQVAVGAGPAAVILLCLLVTLCWALHLLQTSTCGPCFREADFSRKPFSCLLAVTLNAW